MAIYFELTTPERVVEREKVESVTAMTAAGEVTILPGHISYVVPLVPGVARVRKRGGGEEEVVVLGGFLQVRPDMEHGTRVIILADAAERVEEIDEERAEAARRRAEEALQTYRNVDEVKFAEASAAFERALARLRIARRKRPRAL